MSSCACSAFACCPAGMPPAGEAVDPDRCVMRRLGHLSFDSNERSQHQARELKSVQVNAAALLVRLVLHKCHINQLNIYNQVGVVALNLLGEVLDGPGAAGAAGMQGNPALGYPAPAGGRRPCLPPLLTCPPGSPSAGSYLSGADVGHVGGGIADLVLDVQVDSVTAQKIRELNQRKAKAIASEDYDLAKELKLSIDRCAQTGRGLVVPSDRVCVAVVLWLCQPGVSSLGEGAPGPDAGRPGDGCLADKEVSLLRPPLPIHLWLYTQAQGGRQEDRAARGQEAGRSGPRGL